MITIVGGVCCHCYCCILIGGIDLILPLLLFEYGTEVTAVNYVVVVVIVVVVVVAACVVHC
jgi:hypothetical protein